MEETIQFQDLPFIRFTPRGRKGNHKEPRKKGYFGGFVKVLGAIYTKLNEKPESSRSKYNNIFRSSNEQVRIFGS